MENQIFIYTVSVIWYSLESNDNMRFPKFQPKGKTKKFLIKLDRFDFIIKFQFEHISQNNRICHFQICIRGRRQIKWECFLLNFKSQSCFVIYDVCGVTERERERERGRGIVITFSASKNRKTFAQIHLSMHDRKMECDSKITKVPFNEK
jgi:hypothetical protein